MEGALLSGTRAANEVNEGGGELNERRGLPQSAHPKRPRPSSATPALSRFPKGFSDGHQVAHPVLMGRPILYVASHSNHSRP
jgi:hypothetical protein